MKLLLIPALLGSVALSFLVVAAGAANQAQQTHKWKFEPTVVAPWVNEGEEDGEFEPPDAAAGLCRSAPFNTTAVYGPLGSNVDAIVGDQVNNTGFSNFGCTTPQNETTDRGQPDQPAKPRRWRERLPRLLRLHRPQRRDRVGLLLVRRRSRRGATSSFRD